MKYVTPGLIDIDPDDLWKGMSTIAGSWIGGGANQTAMKEIFDVSDSIFSSMVVVDIIVANIWMALDRKSTRLNSSHVAISYAVFCLKTKKSEANITYSDHCRH